MYIITVQTVEHGIGDDHGEDELKHRNEQTMWCTYMYIHHIM